MANTKKPMYYEEAQRLYVEKNYSLAQIAEHCGITPKTAGNWKSEGNWEEKRKKLLRQQEKTTEKLYKLVEQIADNITEKYANDEKPSQAELYTVTRMAALLPNIKKIEEEREQNQESDKPISRSEAIELIHKGLLNE